MRYQEAELRTRRIFALMRMGKKQKEIAAELGINRHAVTYALGPKCKAAYRAKLRA